MCGRTVGQVGKVLLSLMTLALVAGPPEPRAAADTPVDFAKDIAPIFVASCHQCHGSQKQLNGLRLDTRQAALQGGQSGPAMVPGNAAESLLYQKLLGQAKGSPMPFSGQLTSAQIESVRLWLDQGAAWPEGPATEIRPASKHWAYLKPVRPEPPTPSDSGWIRNPIDRFVLPRLEKEGLEPLSRGLQGNPDPATQLGPYRTAPFSGGRWMPS